MRLGSLPETRLKNENGACTACHACLQSPRDGGEQHDG
jgi:hypothetical protein